ncbi:MAG: PEP-CTERM sorting domain-containing protein [Rubrivivax sp.]|nr:PEP-CTERM sorting domain-containing protein [Rubrivivax sp.]
MKLMRHSALAAALAVLSLSCAAQVTYTFTGSTDISPTEIIDLAFVLTVPDYITSDINFDLAELTSCTTSQGSCMGAHFYVDAKAAGFTDLPGLQTVVFRSSFFGSYHYFEAPAFTTPGTYEDYFGFNPATLTVSAVPEPGVWALMLAGLGAGAFSLRRRQA